MKFMYQYPDVSGLDADMLDAGPVGEVAKAAEDAGFGGFAFTEHPAPPLRWLNTGGHQTLDPFVALSYVAAHTSRIKLLTYLSVVPYRNPMLLAKAAASVDILSNGRFILGVGTGYLKGEFRAVGADFDERNTVFEEALEVLPLHWSGEPFDFKGTHFEVREAVARPRPPQGTIPIWIGGNSPLTLRRVATRAQGWMPLTGPAEVFAATRTTTLDEGTELGPTITALRASAAENGRTVEVLVAYSDRSVATDSDLSAHREAFAAYEKAGVDWILIPGATFTRTDTLGFLDRFGSGCINA